MHLRPRFERKVVGVGVGIIFAKLKRSRTRGIPEECVVKQARVFDNRRFGKTANFFVIELRV